MNYFYAYFLAKLKIFDYLCNRKNRNILINTIIMELKCFDRPVLNIAVSADFGKDGSIDLSAVPFVADGGDSDTLPSHRTWNAESQHDINLFFNVWYSWIDMLQDKFTVRLWHSSGSLYALETTAVHYRPDCGYTESTYPVSCFRDVDTLLDTARRMGYESAYPAQGQSDTLQRATDMAHEIHDIFQYTDKVFSLAVNR